jgi:hypothetical protein
MVQSGELLQLLQEKAPAALQPAAPQQQPQQQKQVSDISKGMLQSGGAVAAGTEAL